MDKTTSLTNFFVQVVTNKYYRCQVLLLLGLILKTITDLEKDLHAVEELHNIGK